MPRVSIALYGALVLLPARAVGSVAGFGDGVRAVHPLPRADRMKTVKKLLAKYNAYTLEVMNSPETRRYFSAWTERS